MFTLLINNKMVEYIYTKIIITICLIITLLYLYQYYTNRGKLMEYQRKANQFYYNTKMIFLILFFLGIVAYVTYGIEKAVMERKKLIENYKIFIKMLIVRIPTSENDTNAISEIIKLKNEIANELGDTNRKTKREKVCDSKGVCTLVKTKLITEKEIDKRIDKELEYIQYTTPLQPLRKALEQKNYQLAMEFLIDQLQSLDPNVTVREVCGGVGEVCNVAFGKQHPAIALAFMLKPKNKW